MTPEHQMEQLSRAYVQAVAAMCGCTCARPEPDYGVDLTIRRVNRIGDRLIPVGRSLNLQLKSTIAALREPRHIAYDLEVRAYDLLRRSTRSAPIYLVLLVMPPDPGEWLNSTEDRLELRRCAYWLSLRQKRSVSNARTKTIRIPRENQFTPSELGRIMDAIQQEEDVR
jgi:hypothetical protein